MLMTQSEGVQSPCNELLVYALPPYEMVSVAWALARSSHPPDGHIDIQILLGLNPF